MNLAVSNFRTRLASYLLSSSSLASEAWDGRFRLHKPRGQNLLTNPRVLDAIARHVALRPGDAVLEVGPGTGNLTARLLASPVDRVAAIEIDPRMVEAVTARADALAMASKLTVCYCFCRTAPTTCSIKCLMPNF